MPRPKKQTVKQSRPPSLSLLVGRVPTLAEWRSNPELTQWATNLLASKNGQIAMSVLMDNSPAKYPLPGGACDVDVARAYGSESGFRMALAILQQLAEPLIEKEEVPMDFPDPTV